VESYYHDIHSIQPYAFNPRDNAAAIESVANSIKLAGFVVPVVIDANNVLIAGHTRVEAAKSLGMSEVLTIKAEHLTPAQVKAFRIIDNKVAELAKWDFDLLAPEIGGVIESGIDLTQYGYAQNEIDCLTDMVRDDCLSGENLIDAEAADRTRRAGRRAPATARFVLGELVYFTTVAVYRTWIDDLRTLHDFNEQAMIADVKQRLGIHE